MRNARAVAVVFALPSAPAARAQVENVPVSNQVYEFIDRLGVREVLPAAGTTMVPMSRSEVARLLLEASGKREGMSGAEAAYQDKFLREFDHEIPGPDPGSVEGGMVGRPRPAGLFNGSPAADFLSDREKYLYHYADSSVSLYLEFLGSLEYRAGVGDTWDGAEAAYETHGFRARGTIKNRLGYFAQVTNGTLWGDHDFALADPLKQSRIELYRPVRSPPCMRPSQHEGRQRLTSHGRRIRRLQRIRHTQERDARQLRSAVHGDPQPPRRAARE